MFTHYLDPTGQASAQGTTGEKNFEEVMKKRGITWRPATFPEQMKHWDYLIKDKWRIDCKTAKRLARSMPQQYELTVLELWGGSERNSGWLRGQADGIAFEQLDCWLIFERKKLLSFALRKVGTKGYVTHEYPPVTYQPYRRATNKFEIFIWASIADMRAELEFAKWNKFD